MDPTAEQIAVMVGLTVSFLVWVAKVYLPRYDLAATIYKVAPVVLGSVLTVGYAAHWEGGWQLAWQMALAVASAFGGYKIIGQPILDSLRMDDFEREARLEEANDANVDDGC